MASRRALREALKGWAAVMFALAVWGSAPQTAHASTTIAADLDYDVPLGAQDVKTGAGFAIRIGQTLNLPMLALNPEIGFTYATFDDPGPSTYRGVAGLRLGFGEMLRFGVMAHLGYGYSNYPALITPGGELDWDHGGFTFDGGLFFDFTALPLLNIGLHAAYNRIAAKRNIVDSKMQWIQLGLHAALVL